MTFELIGYTDQLLEQLGFQSHRKGWFKDLFEPCVAHNLARLKEYIEKYGYDEPKNSKGPEVAKPEVS